MFLTDAEIAEMCAPLVAAAAQKRYLRALGLTVNEKPNGRPLVVRVHAEAILSGRKEVDLQYPTPHVRHKPDREAFIAAFGNRKPRGAKP